MSFSGSVIVEDVVASSGAGPNGVGGLLEGTPIETITETLADAGH
jgi:hypothetical protein